MLKNELIDGCMISWSFMPASSKISTYEFTVNHMIKRLYAQHGKTINFLGVLMATLNVKIIPDVDYTAMFVELERLGIEIVGLSGEGTGRYGASQPPRVDETCDGNSGGWEGCIRPDGSFVTNHTEEALKDIFAFLDTKEFGVSLEG